MNFVVSLFIVNRVVIIFSSLGLKGYLFFCFVFFGGGYDFGGLSFKG